MSGQHRGHRPTCQCLCQLSTHPSLCACACPLRNTPLSPYLHGPARLSTGSTFRGPARLVALVLVTHHQLPELLPSSDSPHPTPPRVSHLSAPTVPVNANRASGVREAAGATVTRPVLLEPRRLRSWTMLALRQPAPACGQAVLFSMWSCSNLFT